MSSDAQIVVSVEGRTEGGRVIKRTLDDISNSGDKAITSTQRLEKQMRSLGGAAAMLKSAFAAMGIALGVRELIRMSDSVSLMQGRLINATRSVYEANTAFEGLRSISQSTGVQMETTIGVFQRLSFVRDEIKATMSEMIQFTDTVSKLGIVSGASQEALKAGLTQLGQALSGNIVRAEEWNSIMENIPAVGKQIAEQFGITTGQLRLLVVEGKVLSEDMFGAMLNASQEVEEQFQKMPMTIGRAFAALRTDMELFIGQSAQASGAASIMVGAIDTLRLAVHGLGVGFNALVNIVASAGLLILKDIENLVNGTIERINWVIGLSNKIPGVDMDLLAKKDWTGGLNASDIIRAGQGDRSDIFNAPTPQNTVFDRMAGNVSGTTGNNVRALTTDYKKMADALTDSSGAKSAEKAHKALESAIKASRTEEERLIDTIKELERMRGIAKTADESRGLETAISRARTELDKLRIQVERDGPVAKAFEGFVSQIDDGFRDSFRTAFTESDGGFKKLIEGWKSTFKTFLADLAYMAFARPIMLSLAGVVGGTMGISSGAQASILGDIGGGGMGLGGLGNIGSTVSKLLSGKGLFGTSQGLVDVVNNGGSFLGVNNLSSMSSFTNGSWGGTLGAGLGGFGGNMLANAILGDRGIGSTIGGTLGTIAGSFIPVPVLGPAIGGFLGNALGGLFGGKKPSDKAQWGGLNLSSLSTFDVKGQSGGKYSAENAKFRDSVLSEAQKLGELLKSVGAELKGQLFVHVGNRDGLRVGTDYKENYRNYGNNSAAFTSAVMNTVLKSATGLSDTFQKIIKSVGARDTAKLAEALEFGKYYESIINPVDAVAEAIKAANTQFDAMLKTASSLGLSSAKFTEELNKQRDATLGMIKAQQAGFQSMEAMKATFDGWLKDQSLSGTSSLSPTQKLQLAQDEFGGLLSKVQGGDYSATQQLLGAAQQLLTIGQGVYASSVSFAALESFVRSSVSQIAKGLEIPGYAVGTSSASSGLAWVGERGPELVRFRGGEQVHTNNESTRMMGRSSAAMEAKMSEMADEIRALRADNKAMTHQLSRVANKLSVVAG
jgi:tape measure domain-containing protein